MKKLLIISTMFLTGTLFAQNVGIGTASPLFKLHVNANAPYQNIAMFQNSGGWGQILVSNGTVSCDVGAGEGGGYSGTNSVHDFSIRSAAQERLYLKANGNVGVHQSNPTYKFQILGTTRIDALQGEKVLSIGGNGHIEIESLNPLYHRFKITEDGWVGIGINEPFQKLCVHDPVNSNIAIFQSGTSTGVVRVGTYNAFTNIGASNDGYSFIGTSQPNDFTIRTQDTSRMYIKNSTGHMGIGINNPAHRLHVFQDAPDKVLGLFQGNGGNAQLQVSNMITTSTFGAKDAYGWIGTKTFKSFAICTNDSPRIFIGGTGGVGIGNTAPNYALQVTTNPGSINPIASFESTGNSGKLFVSTPTARLVMGATDNTTYLGTVLGQRVSFMTNNLERLHILPDGNIGIGTTDAPKPLTVRANLVEDVMQYTTNSGIAKWHWWMPGGNLVLTESNVADYRLTIEQGGNVGIGMANPTELLEVNGNLRVNGTLKLSAGNAIEVESPVTVTYQNGWTDYDPAFGSVQYYKDKQKRVYLSGMAERGSFAGTSVVFTLPVGYRPPKEILVDIPCDDGSSHAARMTISASTGEVRVSTFNGAFITWVSFENISFRVN